MRRAAALAFWALPAAAGCVDTAHFYGDEFSQHYMRPAEETDQALLQAQEIVHWGANPGQKRRIGYLFHYEIRVKGSRETRECYYIFDRSGAVRIGFVTAEGVFYRFDAQGRLGERVGEWPILPTGLKVFFGVPLSENVALEEVDPYK